MSAPVTSRCAVALLFAALLAGCAMGPQPTPPSAEELRLPSRFAADGAVGGDVDLADGVELARWWQQFDDPRLAALVERAIAGNPDIDQALARVERARALRRQSASALFPQADGAVSAVRGASSAGPDTESYAAGVDARWALDLFGGQRRSLEAADADLAAAGFDLANVQSLLAAEVASTYVDLVTARRRIAASRASLGVQEQNLQIASWRAQADLVSQLDVEQTRAQRAQTAAALPPIQQAEANARYRLAVLVGEAPGTLDAELAGAFTLPSALPVVAAGLPTALLTRRPDLRASERTLAAATARIGVAKAQRFPGLSLAASIDSSAAAFSAVGDDWVRNLVASLSGPLFDAGQRRATQRAQEASADAAFAAYRKAVLNALEDVERALVARDTAERRIAALTEQRDASNAAATLARLRYREGLTDLRALLESERSLLAADDALAAAGGDQLKAAVQLYLALGGGWSPDPESNDADTAP
jgi:NodT family efflux transporter outer membrane factor (OMF) lipoprotein